LGRGRGFGLVSSSFGFGGGSFSFGLDFLETIAVAIIRAITVKTPCPFQGFLARWAILHFFNNNGFRFFGHTFHAPFKIWAGQPRPYIILYGRIAIRPYYSI